MSQSDFLDRSVRRWGCACHLAGLFSLLLCSFMPIPFLGALPPYLVWKLGRDRHSFIDEQGREAINFQISMTINLLVGLIFWLFLALTTCMAALSGLRSAQDLLNSMFSWILISGVVLVAVFAIFMLATIIFATVKASRGQSYRYPFTMRFLQ